MRGPKTQAVIILPHEQERVPVRKRFTFKIRERPLKTGLPHMKDQTARLVVEMIPNPLGFEAQVHIFKDPWEIAPVIASKFHKNFPGERTKS